MRSSFDAPRPWERIRQFARRYGADIVLAREEEIGPDVVFAPFLEGNVMGIRYEPGQIVVLASKKDLINWRITGGLVHELAHVLASPVPPEGAAEPDFTGWEYLVAQQTGSMAAYKRTLDAYEFKIGETWKTWRWMNPSERRTAIKDAVRRGEEVGNIVEGRPGSVRHDLLSR